MNENEKVKEKEKEREKENGRYLGMKKREELEWLKARKERKRGIEFVCGQKMKERGVTKIEVVLLEYRINGTL